MDVSALIQVSAMIAASTRGTPVRYMAELRRSDADVRKIDISLTPVKDEFGQVVYIVPEGRDVT